MCVVLGGEVVAVALDAGGGGVGVSAVGGGVDQRDDALVVVVGGGGERAQRGGFVGAGMQVEQLDAVDIGGDRGDRLAVGVVEAVEGPGGGV